MTHKNHNKGEGHSSAPKESGGGKSPLELGGLGVRRVDLHRGAEGEGQSIRYPHIK